MLKRIAHIITRMVPGGASNVLGEIVKNSPADIESYVFCGPQDICEKHIKEVRKYAEVTIIPSLVREINPIQDLKAFFRLVKELRNADFDIVHTHTSKAGILGRLAAKLAGIKIIIHTPHGIIYLPGSQISGVPKNRVGKQILKTIERFAGRFTCYLTVISKHEYDICIKLGLSTPSNTIIIPNGIEISKFKNAHIYRKSIREQLAISPRAVLIVSIGRISSEKGHSVLLQAFKEVIYHKLADMEIALAVIGDGPLKKSLEREFQELIKKRVLFFTGYKENVVPYLGAADIFVMPSLYEGFGIAVLEAMAAEVPVIASDVGGIPDIVRHKQNGILFPPGDFRVLSEQIVKLAYSREERDKLKQNALETVKNYSLYSMLEKYYGLYK